VKDKPIVPNNFAPGNPPPPKIGAGHAAAMFRQGLSELRASLYTGSNIAQPAEYGLYGHQTPGEIADDRKPDKTVHQSLDEEPPAPTTPAQSISAPSAPASTPSPLQQSMREAESRTPDRSPEKSRSKGLDRG